MKGDSLHQLKTNISRVVVGKEEALELLLVALLAEGHILIEDVPGVGKTLLAKALASSLGCDFHRIQCTPDLTPTDVSGFYVFDRNNNSFTFRPGPLLTNILLVDEINRAVPRTQSSFLEAMEEQQLTVDGQTIKTPLPFMMVATQNPIEQEGTFPLPEAQLDRFLLKISLGYPTFEEEESILTTHGRVNPLSQLQAVAHKEEILQWQESCRAVFVEERVSHYIIALVRATREHPAVALGASPRASLALHRAARALAFIRAREYVIPDDVKHLAASVLTHRLCLRREDRMRGVEPTQVMADILAKVPVPVERDY